MESDHTAIIEFYRNKNKTIQSTIILDNNLFEKITSHFYLLLIIIAMFVNTGSFVIFKKDTQMRKLSSMIILSYVVIFDTFSLFTWNLNHFLKPNFQIAIEHLNIATCRIFLFMQYMSSQSSSLLRGLVTIDRFVSIFKRPGSIISRLPFTTRRTAHLWSILIIIFTTCLNFHILIYAGVYRPLNSTNTYTEIKYIYLFRTPGFECYEYHSTFNFSDYDVMNMIVYSVFPSFLMITFNLIIFYKTRKDFKSDNLIVIKTIMKTKKLTYSLLAITTAFVVQTLPATIFFAFFYIKMPYLPHERYFECIFTLLEFSNHATVFFISHITNQRFRMIVKEYLIKFKRNSKNLLCQRCRRNKINESSIVTE